MSFVTRNGAGVGDGEGMGVGLGDGPCARPDTMFRWAVANAAAPTAGTSFTNARRSTLLAPGSVGGFLFFDSEFFIMVCCSCLLSFHLLPPAYCLLPSVLRFDHPL